MVGFEFKNWDYPRYLGTVGKSEHIEMVCKKGEKKED